MKKLLLSLFMSMPLVPGCYSKFLILSPFVLSSCASSKHKHASFTFKQLSEYGAIRYLDGFFDGRDYERGLEQEPEIKKQYYNP